MNIETYSLDSVFKRPSPTRCRTLTCVHQCLKIRHSPQTQNVTAYDIIIHGPYHSVNAGKWKSFQISTSYFRVNRMLT